MIHTLPDLITVLGNKRNVVKLLDPQLAFDEALPQPWLNYWHGDDYYTVLHGTVWAYPKGFIMGLPCPVTQEAAELIRKREEKVINPTHLQASN